MKIRTTIAATAAAGLLSMGAAGIAVADTSPTTTTPSGSSPSSSTAPTKGCGAAATRLQILADLDQVAGLRAGLVQQALSKAQTKGNSTRVQRLQDRLTKINDRKGKLEARLQQLETRCHVATPNAAPTP